jgi:hypothetical protein
LLRGERPDKMASSFPLSVIDMDEEFSLLRKFKVSTRFRNWRWFVFRRILPREALAG